MKKLAILTSTAVALTALTADAQASTVGTVEPVKITLNKSKFDTSIPADRRLDMIRKIADRKCVNTERGIEALKFDKACKLEVKRSVLKHIPDTALKTEAKRLGILE